MSIGAALQRTNHLLMQGALEEKNPEDFFQGMLGAAYNPGTSRYGGYDVFGALTGDTEGKVYMIPNAGGWSSFVHCNEDNTELVYAYILLCTAIVNKEVPIGKENQYMYASVSFPSCANVLRTSGKIEYCKVYKLMLSSQGLRVQVIFPDEPYGSKEEAESDNLDPDSYHTVTKMPSWETFREWNPDHDVTVKLTVNLLNAGAVTNPFVKAVYERVNSEISGSMVFKKIRELPGVTLNWGMVKPDV